MQVRLRASTAAVMISNIFCFYANAAETSVSNSRSVLLNSQMHLRVGMLSGSFSGPATGSFSVSNTLDGEFEMFNTSKRSFTIRGILAHDLATQQTKYSYIGVGRRYYLKSKGLSFSSSNESGEISSQPKWRYYLGGDLGIAHVLVKNFGDVLSVTGSVLDFGFNAGTIVQTGKNFGLEFQFGYTMGFGFSSVGIGSTTTRFLVGGSFYF